jgi:hypothetical protein
MCSVEGCEGKHKARGWCYKHWKRWLRRGGDPRERIHRWRGKEVGYHAAHDRVRAEKGRACDYPCGVCGDPAAHWAYDHSDLDERWSIETKFYRFTYSLDANHYQPMCRTCHRRADRLAKLARNSSPIPIQHKLIQNTSQ